MTIERTYHDDAKCGACGGPLDCERDAVCLTCAPEAEFAAYVERVEYGLSLLAKLKRTEAERDTLERIVNDDAAVHHAFNQGFRFTSESGLAFIRLKAYCPYATSVFAFAWRWGAMVAMEASTVDIWQTRAIKARLKAARLEAELAEARAKIARLEAAYYNAADLKVVCSQCQRDDQFGNADRCTKAGWIDIEIDQGFAWNFIGLCPGCRAKDAEAPAAPAITDDDIDADEPFAPLRK